MRKYRIIKKHNRYIIQRKFLFWWHNPFTEYDGEHDITFSVMWVTFESALDFLMGIKKENKGVSVCWEGKI